MTCVLLRLKVEFQDFPTTFHQQAPYLASISVRRTHSFVYSFRHSVITDYVQCHVLNTDLSPKLELLPNMIHFLSATRKGTLHVVHAQTEEKVILNLSPMIRLMRQQSNPASEPSRVYWRPWNVQENISELENGSVSLWVTPTWGPLRERSVRSKPSPVAERQCGSLPSSFSNCSSRKGSAVH